jgi:hypothetical protein
MHPDLYPYEQAKTGGVNFKSRWGPGPAERFRKASAGDFRRLASGDFNSKNLLGLGTYAFEFSTMRHPELERHWAAFKAFFSIKGITDKPPLWPVTGTIWANAPALMFEGDGLAWLVFVGRHGTLWEPMHLYAMWSDGRILMRTWCPDHLQEDLKPLIGGVAFKIAKATPWVCKRDLFS